MGTPTAPGSPPDALLPRYLEHGVYCKKALVTKKALDRQTGEEVEVTRGEISNRCVLFYANTRNSSNIIGNCNNSSESEEAQGQASQAEVEVVEKGAEILLSKYWLPEILEDATTKLGLELEI